MAEKQTEKQKPTVRCNLTLPSDVWAEAKMEAFRRSRDGKRVTLQDLVSDALQHELYGKAGKAK